MIVWCIKKIILGWFGACWLRNDYNPFALWKNINSRKFVYAYHRIDGGGLGCRRVDGVENIIYGFMIYSKKVKSAI